MKRIIIFFLIISVFSLNSCKNNQKIEKNIGDIIPQKVEQIADIIYSNLYDDESKKLVDEIMKKNGIPNKNREDFFFYVNYFNDSVKGENLLKSGFQNIKNLKEYDESLYRDFLVEKDSYFIGTNCRITSFTLLNNLLKIEKNISGEPINLGLDSGAIEDFPRKIFLESEKQKFFTFFNQISTPLTKDISVHLKNVKKYWKNQGVIFSKKDVSIISVILHDELDNILFIGHSGILFPYEDEKFLFVEKLSFNLPYQALIIKNKKVLYDYLMEKYDVSNNQPTAKPFIMENDKLLSVK